MAQSGPSMTARLFAGPFDGREFDAPRGQEVIYLLEEQRLMVPANLSELRPSSSRRAEHSYRLCRYRDGVPVYNGDGTYRFDWEASR